jgi:hypothetical protein
MNPICALDWQEKQVFRGRLALALTGLRAQACSNPRCERERHCRGAFRKNAGAPRGDCPIMTEAEWDAVVTGTRRVRESSRAWYRVEDAARDEVLNSLSKQVRAECLAELERRKHRNREPRWVPYYFDILWTELVGSVVRTVVSDARDAERELVTRARTSGCSCAREGMKEECET